MRATKSCDQHFDEAYQFLLIDQACRIVSARHRPNSVYKTQDLREVLTMAISPDFLDRMGWGEGAHAEIYKDKRVIYDPGYTKAIRRVLGV